MAQDLTGFIKEVWSQNLRKLLDDEGVAMQCVNRNWEGEIKKAGDTVYIRRFGDVTIKDYSGNIVYDELASPSDTLVIDQKKYFAFKVDDISKAQSDINIMEGYTGRAKVAIGLTQDDRIHSHYTSAGNSLSSVALTADNVYDTMVDVHKTLKGENALNKGEKPWIIVEENIEAILRRAPEFIHATKLGDEVLRSGSIGKIAGLDVMVSTNFEIESGTYNVIAGTNDAITFASQVVEMESMRLEGSFDTAVRGLYVYGSKVILPSALVHQPITIS